MHLSRRICYNRGMEITVPFIKSTLLSLYAAFVSAGTTCEVHHEEMLDMVNNGQPQEIKQVLRLGHRMQSWAIRVWDNKETPEVHEGREIARCIGEIIFIPRTAWKTLQYESEKGEKRLLLREFGDA